MGSNSHWNDAGKVIETESFGGWWENSKTFARKFRHTHVLDAMRFPIAIARKLADNTIPHNLQFPRIP